MILNRRVVVVIPALDEEETIALVVGSLPSGVDEIVVADNGSTDRTAARARNAGARVVQAAKRGYGAACLAALAYLAPSPPDIVVFTAGDGSDDPAQLRALVEPVARGACEMCLASRRMGEVEAGAMTWAQRWGNVLATRLIRLFWGVRFTDLGPYRALSWPALANLQMVDEDFGWTVEMQIKAAQAGLRFREISARYRRRQGGRPKVGGTLRGSVCAGVKILWWIGATCLRHRFGQAASCATAGLGQPGNPR